MSTTSPDTTPAPPAGEPAPSPLGALLQRSALARRTGLGEPADHADPSGRFSWLVVGACAWILVGLFIDGWYHINGTGEETFFTPWHAILYSGVAAAVVVHLWEQRRAGGMRPGYGSSLAGGLLVLAAGFVDGVWHTLLGVEADLEALLSPPHLLLITAGTLVFAGPVRAAVRAPAGSRGGLPTAIAAAFVVTGLGFFTQYANPFTQLYPVTGWDGESGEVVAGAVAASAELVELRQVAGVAGIVVWAVLVAGAVALLRARTPLVPGSVFVAVAVPSVFMTTLRGTFLLVPAVLVAAALAELAARRLGPAPLAALSTGALITGWVLSLAAAHDLDWSLELLTGSIGSATAAGYLVGWLVAAGARSRA